MKRLTFYLLTIFPIIILSFGCGGEDEAEYTSPQIKLNLNFAPSQNVTKVTIKVTGEGINEPIIQDLTVDGRKAQGVLTVPPGDVREFTLEVYENEKLILSGKKNMDIPKSGSIVVAMATPSVVGSPSVNADGDIVIEFNTEVDQNSLDKIKISGMTGKATIDGKTVIWKPDGEIPDGEYTIDITGLHSADGTEVSMREKISFTTKPGTDVDIGEMVLIPAGEFEMGDNFNEGKDRERPVHTIYLDAFLIDKYEVTVGQYEKFIQATGHRTPHWDVSQYSPSDDHPIVFVSWHDAMAYSEWAGKRLPTEAEWEKAARGGLVSKRYPWGDENPDGSLCNFADKNTDFDWSDRNVDDGYQYTAPVGSYQPNGYGLYDMAGNVWEWCSDWYDDNYYVNSPKSNPRGPSSGSKRVLRGGYWYGTIDYLRCSYREGYVLTDMYRDLGFRCVQDP